MTPMTHDQLLAWVDGQIADYAPIDDDAGEVRNRFSQIVQARAAFTGATVFGFTIPAELRSDVQAAITERLDASLDGWKTFLANIDGGPGYYERSLVAAGLLPPPERTLVKDSAITRAVAHLRTRLTDPAAATALWRARGLLKPDEHHAFAIAPPVEDLEEVLAAEAARGVELPALVEALYAELGGLWVEPAKKGGERAFDREAEYFVFAPLDLLIDRYHDVVILDQHPDHFSWVMLDPDTGTISTATKLDRTPVKIAGSLVEYLELLAEGYGRVLR
jgi:hypothetical protein